MERMRRHSSRAAHTGQVHVQQDEIGRRDWRNPHADGTSGQTATSMPERLPRYKTMSPSSGASSTRSRRGVAMRCVDPRQVREHLSGLRLRHQQARRRLGVRGGVLLRRRQRGSRPLGRRLHTRQSEVERRALPGFDSTQMRPPCASTIFLQIARPAPVPFDLFAPVQPAEDAEDLLVVLRLDADRRCRARTASRTPSRCLPRESEGDPSETSGRVPMTTTGGGLLLYFRPLLTRLVSSWPMRSRIAVHSRQRPLDADLGLPCAGSGRAGRPGRCRRSRPR